MQLHKNLILQALSWETWHESTPAQVIMQDTHLRGGEYYLTQGLSIFSCHIVGFITHVGRIKHS